MPHSVILVVDDQPEGADLLGMVLESFFPDATVCVAYGGHEALETAAQQRPDVAVLDIEMPAMDGVQLASALREAFPDGSPLLVALSGNLQRISALRHGSPFDHHFSKPADMDAIVQVMSPRLSGSGPG